MAFNYKAHSHCIDETARAVLASRAFSWWGDEWYIRQSVSKVHAAVWRIRWVARAFQRH